ncbi:hypothetical protein CALVIDRAFT_127242 [Calocera viscosa TUFC12733]|uniref:Uncharacterized protein n=1 Tax=Calocera viscosa (strain TUFC12733) TaxID=1330018 RepID=A0A167RRX7_CALVF|nr:hypothetical protein CALVIDRAFT_127242 [Calocera viscosa TUFC12733]
MARQARLQGRPRPPYISSASGPTLPSSLSIWRALLPSPLSHSHIILTGPDPPTDAPAMVKPGTIR